jgi:hypothetical protein
VLLTVGASPALAAGAPEAETPEFRNVTATSAHLHSTVNPRGSATHWRFESAASESGPWTPVPGAAGAVSQAEAEALAKAKALGNGFTAVIGGAFTGLTPATTYYIRLFAEDEPEPGVHDEATSKPSSFETAGPPTATTFLEHALDGESIRVFGSVDPHSTPTSEEQRITIEGAPTGGTFALTFKGQTTGATGTATATKGSDEVTAVATTTGSFHDGELVSGVGIPPGTAITENNLDNAGSGSLTLSAAATESNTGVALTANLPYNAEAEVVSNALSNLPGKPQLGVGGPPGGPYTVIFHESDGGVDQPQIEGDALGLTPFGTIAVVTTQQGGEGYDTHYRFQYVSQEKFAATGWAEAPETPSVDISSGDSSVDVSQDLPGLQAGATYHYRVLATNNSPGNPVVAAEEKTLVVPAPAPVEETGACPNAQFRSGASANLADCRAYEQITPVDKEGATEVYKPEAPYINGGTLYGEDGDHFMVVAASTRWGAGPRGGQGPYFFSRDPQKGWQMTAATPQPEAGINRYLAQIVSPDLTGVGLESSWTTGRSGPSSFTSSETTEFKAGPPGGPYTTLSIPVKQAGLGWVGASEDFSKLILATGDRSLVAAQVSATKQGEDLYEVSGGEVRQLNVLTGGSTVGACGARMARGVKEAGSELDRHSSRHAVSSDGRRVLFEAVPGSNCEGEPENLYMRVNGAETVDIGAYKFLAADAAGSRLLLEDGSSGELFLYETEPASAKHLATPAERTEAEEGLGLIARYSYFEATEYLGFHPGGTERPWVRAHSTGGYQYIEPGGNLAPQLWRYDRAEHLAECISCASPFDPEPRLGVGEGGVGGAIEETRDGEPNNTDFTADGNYAFFETAAALVPQDVNGEVHVEPPNPPFGNQCGGEPCLFPERPNTSPSTDIYEWRRDGVQGCVRIQGCLSLITPGKDGFLVELLGTTPSGHDVFFYTNSRLVPQDDDTAGDVYDARIDGGFAEPIGPIECEGDACSTPFAAPNDLTPSSATFHGAGDVLRGTLPEAKPKSKKKARKKHAKQRAKARKKARRAAANANKSNHRRGK